MGLGKGFADGINADAAMEAQYKLAIGKSTASAKATNAINTEASILSRTVNIGEVDYTDNNGQQAKHMISFVKSDDPDAKARNIANVSSVMDASNKIINGNLNKLSPNNSKKIFLDILKLFEDNILIFDFDNFVDTLFEKAVMQPTYCPLYVKLFIIMNRKHNSLDKENGNKFTDLLIKKCNMFKNMIKEFSAKDDDILNPDNYDDFCEKNKEKVFKKGFSQFIGELYKNHFVNDEFMDEFLEGLVDSIIYNLDNEDVNIENSSICLIQLVETTMNKRQLFQKGIHAKINKIIKYKIIPKKIKFMYLDLLED